MEFGVQFFPSVGPETKSGAKYFDECLKLCELCDPYGYTHVRTVEHFLFRSRANLTAPIPLDQ